MSHASSSAASSATLRLLHPTSTILHPPSSILHPPSSILHPPSSIVFPLSFLLFPSFCWSEVAVPRAGLRGKLYLRGVASHRESHTAREKIMNEWKVAGSSLNSIEPWQPFPLKLISLSLFFFLIYIYHSLSLSLSLLHSVCFVCFFFGFFCFFFTLSLSSFNTVRIFLYAIFINCILLSRHDAEYSFCSFWYLLSLQK